MIVHTKPSILTDRFSSNFGQLISDMLNEKETEKHLRPQLELAETEKSYLLKISLPGLPKEAITLSIEDNILTVSGEALKPTSSAETTLYSDISYGTISRKVQLPKGADSSQIEAEYMNGMLHLTIQKSKNTLPKKIEIK
jgi:HSP20 family protein